MTKRLWRLRLALLLGPGSSSSTLRRLLSARRRGWGEFDAYSGWVADAYAAQLSTVERATLRDALVIAIRKTPNGTQHLSLLVELLALASQIELLSTSRRLIEDRIWAISVTWARSGRNFEAAQVAGLLAAEGRLRPATFWTQMSEMLGSQSAIACALGVLRSVGVGAALEWIRINTRGDSSQSALIALVPMMALLERKQLLSFISVEDPFFSKRVAQTIEDLNLRWSVGPSALEARATQRERPELRAAIKRALSLGETGESVLERYATL